MKNISLRYQLFLGFCLITVLTAFASAKLVDRLETDYLLSTLYRDSQHQFETIKSSALEAIITEDQPVLRSLVDRVRATNEDVAQIVIEDERGQVLVASGIVAGTEDDLVFTFQKDVMFSGEKFGSITLAWNLQSAHDEINRHAFIIALVTAAALSLLAFLALAAVGILVVKPVSTLNAAVIALSRGQLDAEVVLPRGSSRELLRFEASLEKLREALLLDKQRAEELEEAKTAAEAASRAKSQFLANMSHELRTPLNAIMGFSELMAKELHGTLGNPEYREYATLINQSGDHLLQLINDVLDLAKIEAERFKLLDEVVDLTEVIGFCLRVVDEGPIGTGITVELHLAEDLPLMRGDSRRLKQIVMNVVSNAFKFTPPGGTVRVTADFDPQAGFHLEVFDSGVGIAADKVDKVLEPFTQVDGDLNRRHEGAGLGLPLARKLTELHDGAFALSSREGEGTTVTMRFPTTRRAAVAADQDGADEIQERHSPEASVA